jgi:hypothetical protein
MGRGAPQRVAIGKIALLSICIIIAGILLHVSSLKIDAATLQHPDGNTSSISVPYDKDLPAGDYRISGTIEHNIFSQRHIRIIPDDCVSSITINGARLNISGKPRCDIENGFVVNTGRYLHNGKNNVSFIVHNSGGKFGLRTAPVIRDVRYAALMLLIFAFVLLLAYEVLKPTKVRRWLILIFIIGLLLRVLYLNTTQYDIRTHDVDGHIEYIEYIIDHHSLPPGNGGWEFFQPPLYYLFSALIVLPMHSAGADPDMTYFVLQVLSLCLFSIFLIVSILVFEKVAAGLKQTSKRERDTLLIIMSAMLVFWPSGIIHSVRIGNDLLLYPLYALGLFFLTRWHDARQLHDLYLATAFACLALVTKVTGAVLLATIGAVLAYEYARARRREKYMAACRKAAPILLLMVLVASAVTIMHVMSASGPDGDLLVPNSGGLSSNLRVNNSVENYLWLDAGALISPPFAMPFDDAGGRQHYWNYLLKTSLFGEFRFKQQETIAIALNITAIIMAAYAIAGLLISKGAARETSTGVLTVSLALLIAASLFLSVREPFVTSRDFRYILPAMISLCALFCTSITGYKQRRMVKLAAAGYWIAGAFILLSMALFSSLVW